MLASYELNHQLIGAVQCCGGGSTQAQTFLGHLGLPFSRALPHHYRFMEDLIGQAEIEVQTELQNEAVCEEIRETINQRGIECIDQERGLTKIAVSYDMGWSKRSSGRRYDSQSGHAHILGMHTKKILNSYVYNKVCRTCKRAEVTGREVREHHCAHNYAYDRSSKSMESEAILHMAKVAPDSGYLIGTIISDDDTNMRATLKHATDTNSGRLPVSNNT